jgi:tRNA 2-thiouridine synthesizing protein A
LPPPIRLDTSGMLCPVPLLLTARRVRGMQTGARLEVVGDDPAMAQDLRDWCQEAGHRLVELDEGVEGRVRALIEVTGRRTSDSPEESEAPDPAPG